MQQGKYWNGKEAVPLPDAFLDRPVGFLSPPYPTLSDLGFDSEKAKKCAEKVYSFASACALFGRRDHGCVVSTFYAVLCTGICLRAVGKATMCGGGSICGVLFQTTAGGVLEDGFGRRITKQSACVRMSKRKQRISQSSRAKIQSNERAMHE